MLTIKRRRLVAVLVVLAALASCAKVEREETYVGIINTVDVRVGGLGSPDITLITTDDGRHVLVPYIMNIAETGMKLYRSWTPGYSAYYYAR